MPAPTTFSGQDGAARSVAEGMVAGYGSSSIRHSTAFTASMTPSASPPLSMAHAYVFNIVSLTLNRAVSRALKFTTVFRSQ